MSFTHEPSITLDVMRCWDCGRFWASELGGKCPVCAERRVDKLLERIAMNERTISALKGAVTRSKRQKKGSQK